MINKYTSWLIFSACWFDCFSQTDKVDMWVKNYYEIIDWHLAPYILELNQFSQKWNVHNKKGKIIKNNEVIFEFREDSLLQRCLQSKGRDTSTYNFFWNANILDSIIVVKKHKEIINQIKVLRYEDNNLINVTIKKNEKSGTEMWDLHYANDQLIKKKLNINGKEYVNHYEYDETEERLYLQGEYINDKVLVQIIKVDSDSIVSFLYPSADCKTSSLKLISYIDNHGKIYLQQGFDHNRLINFQMLTSFDKKHRIETITFKESSRKIEWQLIFTYLDKMISSIKEINDNGKVNRIWMMSKLE